MNCTLNYIHREQDNQKSRALVLLVIRNIDAIYWRSLSQIFSYVKVIFHSIEMQKACLKEILQLKKVCRAVKGNQNLQYYSCIENMVFCKICP